MTAPAARTLFGILLEQSSLYPAAPAVISGAATVTFLELADRARIAAAALTARGVKRGDRIGLLVSNRIEWLEIFFGASAIGAVTVPFSTWSTKDELEFLIADSEITLLFALSAFGDRDYASDLAELAPDVANGGTTPQFPRLRNIVLIEPKPSDAFASYARFLAAARVAGEPDEASSNVGAMDDALVLYTSGSSAKPKAVRLRHASIVENGFNIGERQGLRPGDKVLLSPPLFWSYGSANALPAAFTHGAALVLQEKFEPAGAIDLIERHGCTALYTLPGITSAMLRHSSFSRARVKTLRTGMTIGTGQDIEDAAEALGATEICNIYGATETYGNCCVTWHHWPLEQRARCQGPPLPGNELRIIDAETGALVSGGEPGLVEIRGHVTPGYSGASSDQNAVMFTADGFYRTGDIGFIDQHGAFVFVGRSTEMIKRAGINVSPAEVEEILRRHPGVALAGVTGIPDRDRGELVIAFVVPNPASEITAEDLFEHCRSLASKYKIPDRIEIRSTLPLTPTGKLQRRELKTNALEFVSKSGQVTRA